MIINKSKSEKLKKKLEIKNKTSGKIELQQTSIV